MCRTSRALACLFLILILVITSQVLLSQNTTSLPSKVNTLPDAPSALTRNYEPITVGRFTFGKVALISAQQAMFAVPNGQMNRHIAVESDDLEHYIQHIPIAGPMFLRISKDRHITRVLRVVQPQF